MDLSTQIIAVLDDLCKKFGIVIDWTTQNILPKVEELSGKFINYERTKAIVWIWIAGIVAILALVILIISLCRDCEFLPLVMGFIIIVCIIVACANIFQIVECNEFPEMVIYDYITKIIQSQRR